MALTQIGLEMTSFPVATVLPYAGSAAPSGWLLAAGQAVSRTTYAALFAAIGTTYGAGDGSTTFAVPDLRGRAVAGIDNMGGTAANRLQVTTTVTTSAGSATATVGSASGLAVGMYVLATTIPSGVTISSISGTTVTLSSGAGVTAGTSQPARFSNLTDPQALGGNGGSHVHALNSAQMPLHGHPTRMSPSSQATATTTTTGGILMYTSNVTNYAEYTGTPTNTAGQQVGGSGGDQAHPNMQPTLSLNHIIKT